MDYITTPIYYGAYTIVSAIKRDLIITVETEKFLTNDFFPAKMESDK